VTAPLDPAPLRRILDGEHAETRDRIRKVLEEPELAPVPPDLPIGEYRERVLELARAAAQRGETGLAYPPEYGGEGAVGASIAGFETMAFGDLSLVVKIGVQFGLWGGAILHLGTKKHHDAYLSDTATLDLPGCFAMSESFHGSNVQHVQTQVVYADGEFIIDTPDEHARKDWIGNAACHARLAAVFAQLEVGGEQRGVHCFVVPIRDAKGKVRPGVTIEDCGHKLGLNGVDNGRLSFDHVRLDRDALLDRYATVSEDGVYESPIENPNKRFFTMLGTLIQGRVSVGGAGISVAKVASTIAVRHALKRRQFGPPGSADEALLLDYRTHQRRLLPDVATTYALHFAQAESVATVHRAFTGDDFLDEERRFLETRAAAIKAMATWHATHTVQACREACGGLGYLSVNRFAALKADSDVFTTFEGDNLVLRQLVAKNLLTDFRDELGELDPLGTVAFYAGQIFEVFAERSAARELVGRLADDLLPFRGDEPDLLDRDHQLHLFGWREDHMRGGAARRLQRGIGDGGDPFSVLVEVQDHVVDVARVHTEKIVLESFARAVDDCPDGTTKEVLDQLCSLYALWHVERDRGWFQEHGKLSSTASKAVLKAVNHLCAQLRPQAGALVEAFGIPEAQLPVPANSQVALAE
jgi:acyl-CoA oxidase